MSENKILVVKDLTVLIKDRFLVKNINFSMESGECYGLIGEDKSGKTSLLKAIIGSLPISSGSVVVDGKDTVEHSEILKEVSICLDPPMFFKYQTIYENFKFLCGLNDKIDKESIIKVLNKFNLAHKLKTRVLFLSYYEKKLMALALAFLTKPKLLLLDEPFKALPPDSVDEIKKYIEANYTHNITLDLLSEISCLNKFYLVHTFTKRFGCSPMNYLCEVRINASKELLATTDYSITEIAQSSGFSSQSYFSQCFLKHCHMTASAYRKSCREN